LFFLVGDVNRTLLSPTRTPGCADGRGHRIAESKVFDVLHWVCVGAHHLAIVRRFEEQLLKLALTWAGFPGFLKRLDGL
jgi:hypothetical protein